ncbi:MAG TPA: extracellular solute-binding protein [Pirellulaceae bacterium]|nr:extracellular solute-binding protein [Pirellulaceae bacterium]
MNARDPQAVGPVPRHRVAAPRRLSGVLVTIVLASAGCWSESDRAVVVYAALDREFSEPLLVEAGATTGLEILPVYDLESTKTVGLVTRLEAERARPACDLFWNNEILHTLRLADQGLLRPLNLDDATWESFPETFRDPERRWVGFAARARVLIVNTDRMPDPSRWPRSITALVDPDRTEPRALAKPTFGTTATHLTVLRSRWEAAAFDAFIAELLQRTTIVSGNKQVATGVGSGEFAFGLTDTDDAIVELESGSPVAIVLPDQGDGESGALLIPNTLVAIAGGPHPAAADRLAAKLIGPETERRLADGPSAQIPLHASLRSESRAVSTGEPPRWMEVDWTAASRAWPETRALLLEHWRD